MAKTCSYEGCERGTRTHELCLYHRPRKAIKMRPLTMKGNLEGFMNLGKSGISAKPKQKRKTYSERSKAKKALDTVFSQYVRLSVADGLGEVQCVTCPTKLPVKNMQAGHFYQRDRIPTRWDEMNVHPQCARCNLKTSWGLGGNLIVYTRYMIDRYGRHYVDKLEQKSLSKEKIPTSTIKDMIEEYKLKVKELQENK